MQFYKPISDIPFVSRYLNPCICGFVSIELLESIQQFLYVIGFSQSESYYHYVKLFPVTLLPQAQQTCHKVHNKTHELPSLIGIL